MKAKRLVSLVVSIYMLISIVPMGIVSASASTPIKVFDLEISDVDGDGVLDAEDVTSSVGGYLDTTTPFTISGTPSISDTGHNKKYIRFSYMDGTTEQEGSNVLKAIFNQTENTNHGNTPSNLVVANADELTLECWANVDPNGVPAGTTTYANMWEFGGTYSGDTQSVPTISVQQQTAGSTTMQFYADKNISASASFGDTSVKDGVWRHYVYTRKYNEDSTWTTRLFIDGVQFGADQTIKNKTKTTYTNPYSKNGNDVYMNTLSIGGSLKNAAMPCSIGDLKLYTGILSDETIKTNFLNEKASYGVGNRLESSSVANNSTLSDVFGGKIELDFLDEIKDTELSKITFAPDGSTKNISVITKNNVDPSKVIVTYGRLEEGATYKLKIPADIRSVGESVLANDEILTFTAPSRTYLVNNDFESLGTVGEGLGGEVETVTINGVERKVRKQDLGNNIYFRYFHSDLSQSGYPAIEEHRAFVGGTTADKNITLKALNNLENSRIDLMNSGGFMFAGGANINEWNDDLFGGYTPGSWGEDISYVLEAKMSGAYLDGGSGSVRGMMINDLPMVLWGNTGSGGKTMQVSDKTTLYDQDNPKSFDSSGDGQSHVRLVIGRSGVLNAKSREQLQLDLYDAKTGEYMGAFDQSINSNSHYLDYIRVLSVYSNSENGTVEGYIDDVKLYAITLPEVMKSWQDGNSIYIKTEDDVDTSTIESITAKVEGKEISFTPAYDANNRTISLQFAELRKEGEYTIDLSGIRTASEKFPFETKSITQDVTINGLSVVYKSGDTEIETQEALNAATSVVADAQIRGYVGKTPIAFLAIYEDTTLVKVVPATVVNLSDDFWTIDATASGLTPLTEGEKNRVAKVFVWEDFNTIVPLYGSSQCL